MRLYANNPCQGCEDRHVGCHAECERHQEWVAEKDRQKAIVNAARDRELGLDEFERKAKVKIINARRTKK